MKEALLKRTEEDLNRQGGAVKYLKTDIDFKLWKPGQTKGEPHIIDLIPYVVGKGQPPLAMEGKLKEGDDAFFLELEVHQNIGPGKIDLLCPAKNYGKPCPICEHIEDLINDGAEYDDYSDIATKRRCLYNVLVVTNEKTKAKGVQIWEVSARFSQDKIKPLAKDARTGKVTIYHHPDADTGKSISFEIAGDKYKTQQGHKFLDRNYDISDEILDQALPLDELLFLQSYDYIANTAFGDSGEAEKKEEVQEKKQEKEPDPPVRSRLSRREEAKSATSNPCPNNMNFGHDIDKAECCKACEEAIYQKCCMEADRLDDEKKKAEEEAAKAQTAAATGSGRRLLRRNQS
jgi:hypothetical protein